MNNLVLLKNTLDKIEVRGEENLRMLLGCIQLIETMMSAEGGDDENNPE